MLAVFNKLLSGALNFFTHLNICMNTTSFYFQSFLYALNLISYLIFFPWGYQLANYSTKKCFGEKYCPGNWCPYVFVQTFACNFECVCACGCVSMFKCGHDIYIGRGGGGAYDWGLLYLSFYGPFFFWLLIYY